jgi:hypothetical protein
VDEIFFVENFTFCGQNNDFFGFEKHYAIFLIKIVQVKMQVKIQAARVTLPHIK